METQSHRAGDPSPVFEAHAWVTAFKSGDNNTVCNSLPPLKNKNK